MKSSIYVLAVVLVATFACSLYSTEKPTNDSSQDSSNAIYKIDQQIKTKRANVEQSVITARMRALWTEVEKRRGQGHLHTLEELAEIQEQSDEFINNGIYLSKEQRQQLKLHGADLFNREYLSNQNAYTKRNQEIQRQDILSPLNNMSTLEGKIEYIEEYAPTMIELGVDVEKLRKDTITDMYYNMANNNPSELLARLEEDKAAAKGDRAYGGLAGEINVNTVEAMSQKANSKIQAFQEARGQDVIYGEVIDAMVGFIPQTAEEFEIYEARYRELNPTDVRRALEFSLRNEGMPIIPADIEKLMNGFMKRKEGFRLESIGLPLTTNEKLEVLEGLAPDVAAMNNLSFPEYQDMLNNAVNSGAVTPEYAVQLETMFRQAKQAKLDRVAKLYNDAHEDRSKIFWEVAQQHVSIGTDMFGNPLWEEGEIPYNFSQVSDYLFERSYRRLSEEGETRAEYTIRIYTDGVKDILGRTFKGKQSFIRVINEELEIIAASDDNIETPLEAYKNLLVRDDIIKRGVTKATVGVQPRTQRVDTDVVNIGKTHVRPTLGITVEQKLEVLRSVARHEAISQIILEIHEGSTLNETLSVISRYVGLGVLNDSDSERLLNQAINNARLLKNEEKAFKQGLQRATQNIIKNLSAQFSTDDIGASNDRIAKSLSFISGSSADNENLPIIYRTAMYNVLQSIGDEEVMDIYIEGEKTNYGGEEMLRRAVVDKLKEIGRDNKFESDTDIPDAVSGFSFVVGQISNNMPSAKSNRVEVVREGKWIGRKDDSEKKGFWKGLFDNKF